MNKMFSFPDIMPTLFAMCNLPIPETLQGLDYTGQLLGTEELDVEAALITCPVSFHHWSYKKADVSFVESGPKNTPMPKILTSLGYCTITRMILIS